MQNKPPIIFLHGWGGNKNSWDKNASYFENLGFRALALKMPGFGLPNPLASWGISEYAGFAYEEISKTFPGQKIILVGHSFGGRISIYLSSKYPQLTEALVLTDSAGLNLEPPFLRQGLLFASKSAKWLEDKTIFSSLVKKLREVVSFMVGSKNYKNADGTMKEVFKNIVNLDLRDKLALIKCPTLIVWGEMDEITPMKMARAFNNGMNNSKLIVIKGAGHAAHQTNSEEWNRKVEKFLSEYL